jgi:hypothetical protein
MFCRLFVVIARCTFRCCSQCMEAQYFPYVNRCVVAVTHRVPSKTGPSQPSRGSAHDIIGYVRSRSVILYPFLLFLVCSQSLPLVSLKSVADAWNITASLCGSVHWGGCTEPVTCVSQQRGGQSCRCFRGWAFRACCCLTRASNTH